MTKNINPLPIEYHVEEAYIAELKAKYSGLKIVDTASYKTIQEGIREFRTIRTGIEKRRKELKADALEFGRNVDAEAKRLTALVSPMENELNAEKKKEDDRKAAIEAKKAKLDQERVDGIRKQIDELKGHAENIATLSSDELRGKVRKILTSHVDESIFEEFTIEAEGVRLNSLSILKEALKTKMQLEKEDAERKAEAERLEKIRLEQEAERDRLTEEQRKIDDEKAKIEAEKKAEAERKEREKFERKAKEEARIQAEKDAKEKAEREEQERIAKEKAEAKEAARQEALKPDKEKLWDFANTLENMPTPTINNPEANKLLLNAIDEISDIANKIRHEAKNL